MHCLPPAVLHTASTLLQQTQQARLTRASSLPWLGETLNLNPDIPPGVCFAISSFPCGSTPSPDLRRAFVSCSVNPPERRVLLQALLLAHEFKCHHRLAQTLDTVLSAVDELFNSHFSVTAGEAGNRIVTLSELPSSVRPTIPLGLRLLQQIATAGQKYMLEFEKLGVLQGETLEDRSTVLSDISEGARASLKLRATSLEQASTRVCVCVSQYKVSFALEHKFGEDFNAQPIINVRYVCLCSNTSSLFSPDPAIFVVPTVA